MEVTKRSWASAHWTNSTLSSAPVSSVKASPTSSKNASESGLVPSMIQTLSVSPSALTSPLSPPFDPPAQAVSPNAAVASTATGSKRFFIDASSLKSL